MMRWKLWSYAILGYHNNKLPNITILHEREWHSSSRTRKQSCISVYFVCYMNIHNIFTIYEVWLAFIVECDLVHECLEGLFLIQNMHLEDVHKNRSVKFVFQDRSELLYCSVDNSTSRTYNYKCNEFWLYCVLFPDFFLI